MFVSGRRPLIVAAVSAALALGAVSAPAAAAAGPPAGHLMTVRQNTFTHTLKITGWAVDPARPRVAVRVRIFVDGVLARTIRADRPSRHADRVFHLTGSHGYAVTLRKTTRARTVTVKSRGIGGPMRTLAQRSVTHFYPAPGARIIDVAKQFVGGRYVEGGVSPSGFDCSGYTMYAYDHAHVHALAHNTELQRQSMRQISRANARPGDLVFYMSGGTSYHVAIYAGHGWQYAAATVRDGVRYQRVWSSAVRYGTDWH